MNIEYPQRTERRSRPKVNSLQYAVRLLSVRSYSEKRLREKLAGRQFTPEEIDSAVKRLRDERLLDDRNFAEEFVRTRLLLRPRTGAALLRDLLQRGISKHLAQEVIAEMAPKDQDEALARELLRRKASLYAGLDDQTRRRRIMSMLARRGFSYDTIDKVLKAGPGDLSDES
ncbi:MAG TPA: regulatory protein RecX [bacterium]